MGFKSTRWASGRSDPIGLGRLVNRWIALISMGSALCAFLHVLDVFDCNILCVCENASMSVYPHACDDMLYDSLGVVVWSVI